MNLSAMILSVGYLGVFAAIFAESGLFFGFFLPGDSLLITAGLLAAGNYFNIWILTAGSVIAAISGDSVGYWFGKKVGPGLFRREESFFFKPSRLAEAREFYAKHGKKTVFLARFFPFIRTFAPIAAGAALMNYGIFLVYNVAGGIVWGGGIVCAGYYLGKVIPNLDQYIWGIILAIVLLSLSPFAAKFLRRKRRA